MEKGIFYKLVKFVDFSKAFDTIKHEILLSKLSHYGIRGIALDLICDYLTNRKQFVFYDNDCYSQLSDISIGVPQGSVLGPLFFIIYVNDIISCMDDSVKIILFADSSIRISSTTQNTKKHFTFPIEGTVGCQLAVN